MVADFLTGLWGGQPEVSREGDAMDGVPPLADLGPLLAALPEPVILLRGDNRIVMANPDAEELLGRDLAGQSVFAVIRQPEPLGALERALAAYGGSRGARSEARFVHSTEAAETTYRMVIHRLDPPARDFSLVISFLDISHVEEAEQMRRDFVANVSHELRSPLTVLTGFIETLQGAAKDDAEARARFLEIMAREAQRMNRLVDDLLSLSKVEANERVRPRATVNLIDVIRTTLAALRPQVEDNGIALTLDDSGGPFRVTGDHDQLTQVFHNLIENAIKYGGSGGQVGVVLTCHDRWPGFTGRVISVEVSDRGEGIDPVHIPRLTERFYRVDSHRSRDLGGTGLGLAIVKHILNRHRGKLMIDSTRGLGSTFTVILPALAEG